MTTKQSLRFLVVCVLTLIAVGAVIRGQDSKPDKRTAEEKEARLREERRLKELAERDKSVEFHVGEGGFRIGAKPITGAPFSAQVVIENTQTLADGGRIHHKAIGAIYRDSEGRTRTEQPRDGPPEMVLIDDSTAGVVYKLHMFKQAVWKETYSVERNRELEAHRELERKREVEEKREMEEKHRANQSGGEPERKAESLGRQIIDGVEAEGQRLTIRIPAGKEGNERPLEIVSESWYSPQLQVQVLSKHSDPRKGEFSYRLTSISLSEPARSLFEVPAGFTQPQEDKERRWKEELEKKKKPSI